jgi:hypothetical protein
MSDTETIWKQRVASWRASGETAETFSVGRGWSPKTLLWWSSRLQRHMTPPVVRVAQLVRSAEPAPREGSIVVEVLDARLRVTIEPGADRETVVMVLDRLASRADR